MRRRTQRHRRAGIGPARGVRRAHRAFRRRRGAWAALALVVLVAACAGDEGSSARQTVPVMGTGATVEVWTGDEASARSATDAVVQELRRVEALLSSWTPDSEVGRINAQPVGEPLAVSPELAELMEVVQTWTVRSHGAFQPVLGALIDAWDLRGEGRRPSAAEVRQALAATGAGGLAFHPDQGAVTRFNEAAWMDSGAFGKGAALATAADTLRERGVLKARVDLGGQLLILGGDSVSVGVAHPARRNEVAARLALLDVSVATSGQSERYVDVEEERLGHIIDPRTGEPAPAWGSVTVVARDPLLADILATAFLVLGPEQGMPLAQELQDVGVLFLEDVGEGLQAESNAAMAPWLRDVAGVR